jgi:hypothetical protein
MTVTCAELLEVVYRFYPRGLAVRGLGYEDTVERQRQRDAMERAVAEAPTWNAMLDRLEARYGPPMDDSVLLLSGSYDPAWSGNIFIPGHAVGFCVSLLGPYYGILRTGAAGEEAAALDLAREIEATYSGYQPIPPELGDLVVPDVALDPDCFGRATIYNCLLSEIWHTLSGPWPPPPRPPLSPPEIPRGASVVDRADVPHDDAPEDEPPRSR